MMTIEERNTAAAIRRAATEVTKHLSEIDWEQRRYEIAKEMLPQLYKRSFEVVISGISAESERVQGMLCAGAIEFADELIKQLKGDE